MQGPPRQGAAKGDASWKELLASGQTAELDLDGAEFPDQVIAALVQKGPGELVLRRGVLAEFKGVLVLLRKVRTHTWSPCGRMWLWQGWLHAAQRSRVPP